MNFKPDKLKLIIAIIVFVILELSLAFILSQTLCLSLPGKPACPTFVSEILNPMVIVVSLLAALIAYVIISLLQKKK